MLFQKAVDPIVVFSSLCAMQQKRQEVNIRDIVIRIKSKWKDGLG